MAIQPGADGGAAEREFLAKPRSPSPARVARILDLLRVAAKFLPEPHRRRIHQMRAADLDHVPELRRLRVERAVQFFERGHEAVFEAAPPR